MSRSKKGKRKTLYVVEVLVVRQDLEQDEFGRWCIVNEDGADLIDTIAVESDREKARAIAMTVKAVKS